MSHPAFPGHLSPQDPDLSERQRRVFAALVTLYERSARPVGSAALAREAGIPLSPASIRSELADLEARGLLERSHPSSGRVPTAPGYDLFVRTLLTPVCLSAQVLAEVRGVLMRSTRDVDELLSEASRLLSALTRQLGLAIASSLEDEPLRRLDLEPVHSRRVLMVLNLGDGAVQTLVLELESPLETAELMEVAAVLRQRLLGCTLREVRERLAGDPELVHRSAVRMVARTAAASMEWASSTPLFSAGASHMVEQPEFDSAARMGPILRLVETGHPLGRLMVSGVEGQAAVRVGIDEDRALAGCSLVSYPLPGAVRGAVGVLGPRRMDYARMLAMVDAVGSEVAELLHS